MAKRIDDSVWIALRTEYIEGFVDDDGKRSFPSHEYLAKKYGMAKSTVTRRSRAEDWQSQKNQFHTEVDAEVKEVRKETIVAERVDFDTRCTEMAHDVLDKVIIMLAGASSLSEAESAMRSLVLAQKIGKLAIGDATEIQKVAADVSVPESYTELMRIMGEFGERKADNGRHTIQ